MKKLDSLFKLGELWLRLRIYSDTFVAQLQSLVSARKHYLSDNLNKIDTEVIDLLDEFKVSLNHTENQNRTDLLLYPEKSR